MTLPRRPPRPAVATLAAVLAVLAGCSTQIILPEAPKPDTAPAATTPVAALGRLAWSWKHKALDPARDLFSCDYEFAFAPGDTSGTRFQGRPWTRPDELAFAQHLFETGSASAPAASYVDLDMESDPTVLADDRPGKDPRWHRRIETPFVAVVQTPDRQYRVLGIETFYFVRGDSACIPQELRDKGYGPDSTRWWIARWEDYSVTTTGALRPGAQPVRPVTLGAVKSVYLDSPPSP